MKKVKLILMGFLALSLIFSTFSCAKDAPDTTPGNNNSQNFDDEDEDEELDDEDEDENEDLPEGSDNYCTITFHSNDGKNQVYTQKFLIGGSNIYHKLKPSQFHRDG